MKKLQNKLDDLLNLQSDLGAEIERIEDKIRRKNFRRTRKQFRKRLFKDTSFRAVNTITSRIERNLYGDLPEPGQMTIIGLSAWLSKG